MSRCLIYTSNGSHVCLAYFGGILVSVRGVFPMGCRTNACSLPAPSLPCALAGIHWVGEGKASLYEEHAMFSWI